jgi:tetratricopeptide (TPR) repeat protein
MLYERRGDYRHAAAFWERRIELGSAGEVWTEKAKQRLEALRRNMPELRQQYIQEEIFKLVQELSSRKRIKRFKDLAEANRLFEEAKALYQNAEYEEALNSVNLALNLDPEDKESVLRLKNEIEKGIRIVQMQTYFKKAMRYFRQDDLQEAEHELDKIATEITSKDKPKSK